MIRIIHQESTTLAIFVPHGQSNQIPFHASSIGSNLTIPKNLKITDSIVKPPQNKTEGISKKYSIVTQTCPNNEDQELNNMTLSKNVYL